MKRKTRIVLILFALIAAIVCFAAACKVGNDNPSLPPETPPEEVTPPAEIDKPEEFRDVVIRGADDVEIVQGRYFDCFAGVTAETKAGKDLSAHLKVSGNLNTSKAGEYTLVYSVFDGSKNTAEKRRKVTVLANPEIGKVKPVPVYSLSDGANYNIAKGCAATATNTSNGSAQYAFDGDLSTRWESDWQEDVTLTVNLGVSLAVDEIIIDWEAAYAKSFEILISQNGNDYTAIKREEDITINPDAQNRRIYSLSAQDGTEAQFVRLHCFKRAMPAYGYSVFEFKVLGPAGTVVPKEQYPDLFDAQKDGSPDWRISDGQWLEYDLGSVREMNRMRIAFSDNLTPAAYRVLLAGADKNFTETKLYNLPYSADTFRFEANADVTKNVRYIKIELDSRRFFASCYRVNEVAFINYFNDGGNFREEKLTASVTASSAQDGHGAALTLDGNDATYWENLNSNEYQTVDLGAVKSVGRVDLYWRGDDGGKGKYYDFLISSDGQNWKVLFRQTHGATAKQSIFVYEEARYLRVVDYQSPSSYRHMLEGMVVHSQYPQTSGEGKVDYDVSLAFPSWDVVQTANGSYVTGGTDFPSARLIAYLDEPLRGKPVPSNDWWQGLLIKDKGYNMYMNPLTATFMTDGLWLTNPGEGYFDGFVPGNGSQTVDVDAHDLAVGYAGMGKDAEVRVKGYSDYGISAVMTDDNSVDKLTVFLSEGSLYSYCIFAEPQKALLLANDLIKIYDLNGGEVLNGTGSSYVGDGIVVKVRTHSGYEGGIRKYKDADGREHENAPLYEERYYVVSVPANTRFVMGESSVSVIMTEGNYMSVGAVAQKNTVEKGGASDMPFPLKEVDLLHEHGYAFVIDTSCRYAFDGTQNIVSTEFRLRTMLMREGFSSEAYSAYLPHQLSKSDYKEGYVYTSVRGDCRSHVGNSFVTRDTFYGVVPTFAEPDDDLYSVTVLYNQLLMVYKNNGGDKLPEESNLISGDPYWQGKNLHPMAMAAIASDQIGAIDLRDKFLDKIEYILEDWFTYDPVKDAATGAYFYYDKEWGTLYYKNSEFGAGVNLADHYFTYGYYTLASGVLCAYRPEFAAKHGDMIELLIRDYMNPDRDDALFPYMRNFDPFAGHGWAGGYADNNGGNNQESAGEALNSWVGAYLYATAVGNEKIRQAAIYGYTTELNAIKHYWFNYFNDFPESYQYGVAGQVYGGSNFYGTFFNGQPLFMYGIHLIPGEEYLTSYALNESERVLLEKLIDNMRKEQAGWDVPDNQKEIYAWQHIFIPIVAIYDADEALEWYDEVLRKQGSVGNDSEQFNVYWLIHGMKSTGVRTTDIWAENGESATVYSKDGGYTALCWNPTASPKKFIFRNADGVVGYAVVQPRSLVSCDPEKQTDTFQSYKNCDSFGLNDYAESEGVTADSGRLQFAQNGRADYLLSFGSEGIYRSVKINGTGDIKLFIDGGEVALSKTDYGYESAPVSLTFKHKITIGGSGATVTGITFEKRALVQSGVGMKATASSENNNNASAGNAVDGDMSTRWESVHGSDGEWLKIELDAPTEIYQMKIFWEAASAKQYKVYFSATGKENEWTEVFYGEYSQGARTDVVTPSAVMPVKYILIQGISRTTPYGYSVYEVQLFNFKG